MKRFIVITMTLSWGALTFAQSGVESVLTYLIKNKPGYKEYLNPKDSSILIEIPAGSFTMGSTAADTVTWPNTRDEYPQHTVYLNAYQTSKYEITNSQYKAFIDAGGYADSTYWTTDGWTWRITNSITEPLYWTSGEYNSGTDFPDYSVNGVSWYEAYAFCKWAGGSLPTEAQWEKAARYTDARYYPWGSTWDAGKCNSGYNTDPDTFTYSSPVGIFLACASYYGVYDMAGNVWEWVNDWYDDTYYIDPNATNNPPGPTTGSTRVIRGGSFVNSNSDCRSAGRRFNNPYSRTCGIGFRVANNATGLAGKPELPMPVSKLYLEQNKPNPFIQSTTISYQLPASGPVSLRIYNATGQLVKTFDMGQQQSGSHQVEWRDSKIPAGVYFYRLTAGKYQAIKKLMIVK